MGIVITINIAFLNKRTCYYCLSVHLSTMDIKASLKNLDKFCMLYHWKIKYVQIFIWLLLVSWDINKKTWTTIGYQYLIFLVPLCLHLGFATTMYHKSHIVIIWSSMKWNSTILVNVEVLQFIPVAIMKTHRQNFWVLKIF